MSYYSHISISPLNNLIDYTHSILTIGSCFSDQIGRLLVENRFDTLVNPFGIQYNPYTISKHLATAVTSQTPNPDGYVSVNGVTYHHDFHSSLRANSQDELAEILHHSYQLVSEKLKVANTLIITLGTAVAYRQSEGGMLVGNCHKVPQSQFTQSFLSGRAITTRLSTVFTLLREQNPNLQIIVTVSPVRYLKFGAVTNNRSKAQLLTAAMKLEERHKFVTYWPAYELFIDELRDYRWVESDLVHPNQQAIQQIWSRFTDSVLTDESKQILKEVKSINSQLAHRPFNPESKQHKLAQSLLRKRIEKMKKEHPYLKISEQEVTI